jgi:hypothetical protein
VVSSRTKKRPARSGHARPKRGARPKPRARPPPKPHRPTRPSAARPKPKPPVGPAAKPSKPAAKPAVPVEPALPGAAEGRRHVLSLSFLRDGDEFMARLETDGGQITELKNRSLDQLLTLVASELEDLLE